MSASIREENNKAIVRIECNSTWAEFTMDADGAEALAKLLLASAWRLRGGKAAEGEPIGSIQMIGE